MPALNKVQLIGYLGRDPETRAIPSGQKVTTFSLAVTRRWKSGSDGKEATDWFQRQSLGAAGRDQPAVSEEGQPGLRRGTSKDRQV